MTNKEKVVAEIVRRANELIDKRPELCKFVEKGADDSDNLERVPPNPLYSRMQIHISANTVIYILANGGC